MVNRKRIEDQKSFSLLKSSNRLSPDKENIPPVSGKRGRGAKQRRTYKKQSLNDTDEYPKGKEYVPNWLFPSPSNIPAIHSTLSSTEPIKYSNIYSQYEDSPYFMHETDTSAEEHFGTYATSAPILQTGTPHVIYLKESIQYSPHSMKKGRGRKKLEPRKGFFRSGMTPVVPKIGCSLAEIAKVQSVNNIERKDFISAKGVIPLPEHGKPIAVPVPESVLRKMKTFYDMDTGRFNCLWA